MSNTILEGLVKEKDFTFKKLLFKIVKSFKLDVNELLLLVYFINEDKPCLDIKRIALITYMDDKDIMSAFSSLSTKGLINLSVIKDSGKITEIVDISNTYKAMVSDINIKIKKKTNDDVFSTFEKEFGRPLSPMEYEIIRAWIASGMSEELLIGALKEATFNDVRNLRYIDKILLEWANKGFKTMDEVNNHLKKRVKKEEKKELFDYDWLSDGE